MHQAWIAERTLRDGEGHVWTVAVGIPRPTEDPRVWACPQRITHAGGDSIRLVHGVDAMQALELAISNLGVERRHAAKAKPEQR